MTTRQAIGFVEFQDLLLKTRSRIIITRTPGNDRTLLFLDQGGDVEVGLDRKNTIQLLSLVQNAQSILRKGWNPIGTAEFSWSDHADESESGEDFGTVLIESNGSVTRMVLQTKMWDWSPYVATFDSSILTELATLLSRALKESQ